MYKFSQNISEKEYNEFAKNSEYFHIMQAYNWANIKDNWERVHFGLYKDNKLISIGLGLIKESYFGKKIMYIPRGFTIDYEDINALRELTKGLKNLAKEKNICCIKLDPNFCVSEKYTKDEEIRLTYAKDFDIKKENLIKLGYKFKPVYTDMHKSFQPQFNIFARMCDNDLKILNETEILAKYKSKHKYYLGDFHKKRGITFEITDEINRMDDFINLIKETEKKQNIKLRDKKYFTKLMENYKGKAYFIFAKMNKKKYKEFLVSVNKETTLIDEVKDKEILLSTGLFIMPINEKGIRTSEYLYAGNKQAFLEANASIGLVFEMIKYSAENGCHFCNLGGVEGTLNDPLTIFKEKFNSEVMIFPEFDLPTSFLYYIIKMINPKIIRKAKK